MEMDRPDMQTPDDAAARYSFLFPIGESRRFKPSHPTIGDMCVNATLPLASRARRPRDLLPHSAPSGRCCSPICCPPLLSTQPQARPRDPGIQGSFSAESAPHSASAVVPFPSVRPSAAATRLSPWLAGPMLDARHGDYVCVNAVSSLCPFCFHHVCRVHSGTGVSGFILDAFPQPRPHTLNLSLRSTQYIVHRLPSLQLSGWCNTTLTMATKTFRI